MMWSKPQNLRLFLSAFFLMGSFSLSAHDMDFHGSCPAAVRALREQAATVQSVSEVVPDSQQRSLFERHLGQGPKKPSVNRPKPGRERDRVEISDEARRRLALDQAVEVLGSQFDRSLLVTEQSVLEAIRELYKRGMSDFEEAEDAEDRNDARLVQSHAREALKPLTDAGVVGDGFKF